jgi:uncharacterized protein with von Willebrand factor type A (vWA) domain
MTLRMWVADIDSVCYGRNRERFVVGLAGNARESQRLAQHLASFARNQAVVVSPSSARDAERAAQMSEMNRTAGLAQSAAGTTIVPLPGTTDSGDKS